MLTKNTPLVAVELITACIWVGSLVCLAIVANVARRVLDGPSQVIFFRVIGRRYAFVGTGSLLVAIGTGVVLAVAAVVVVGNHRRRCRPRRRPGAHHRRRHGPGPRDDDPSSPGDEHPRRPRRWPRSPPGSTDCRCATRPHGPRDAGHRGARRADHLPLKREQGVFRIRARARPPSSVNASGGGSNRLRIGSRGPAHRVLRCRRRGPALRHPRTLTLRVATAFLIAIAMTGGCLRVDGLGIALGLSELVFVPAV